MKWLKIFGVPALAAASTFLLAACIAEMRHGEHVDGFILGWSSLKLARLLGIG